MSITNIVPLSNIENRCRLEAEFYQPHYVAAFNSVRQRPHVRLRVVSRKISDGTHFTPRYTEKGIKFYSAVNVKDGFFNYDGAFKYISPNEHQLIHKRCPVASGDVLIRKVGVGPRWSCVVPEGLSEFSIFVSVAMVRTTERLVPEYLSTFINCRYGQLQLLRLNKGISQPDLHLEDIGDLLVPDANRGFQSEICELVRASEEVRRTGKTLYEKAELILESALGFANISVDKPSGVAARFSAVELGKAFASGRIDAQCFAPAALFFDDSLRGKHRSAQLATLLDSAIKGRQHDDDEKGSADYCSIKHVTGRELVGASRCFPSKGTAFASRNDLLLAITGATIGKVGIVKRYSRLVFSGDLLRLRANGKVDPHYLLAALNHEIGQIQFTRWITGSTNGHLAPRDVRRVLVPRLEPALENEIAELVEESLLKKVESERLLEEAKARVERFIEDAVKS